MKHSFKIKKEMKMSQRDLLNHLLEKEDLQVYTCIRALIKDLKKGPLSPERWNHHNHMLKVESDKLRCYPESQPLEHIFPNLFL